MWSTHYPLGKSVKLRRGGKEEERAKEMLWIPVLNVKQGQSKLLLLDRQDIPDGGGGWRREIHTICLPSFCISFSLIRSNEARVKGERGKK